MAKVIVIGSGPIGAICARRLAELGLEVHLLEAGEPVSSPPGSHLRNQPVYQNDPDRFFDEITRWTHFFDPHQPLEGLPGASKTEAFGGQGLIWTANCPRPTLYYNQWTALTPTEWENRLTQAEQILSVHSNLFDDSERQKSIVDTLAPFLKQMDRTILKLPVAAKKGPKGTIHFISTQDILKNTSVNVHCKTRVLKLNKKGARIVNLTVAGAHHTDFAADFYICANGAFDMPDLLYRSSIHSPALGKYLHFHTIAFGQCILNNTPQKENDPPPRLYIPPTEQYPWQGMILRDLSFLSASEQADTNRLVEVQFFAPMDIQESNQMILGTSPFRFKSHFSENDQKIISRMLEDQKKIVTLLGRFRKGSETTLLPQGMGHPMGTCRMGEDPQTSVTNQKGRVYGLNNLFLAGPALIPLPIANNPTLSAAAIALETCEAIANFSKN